MTRSWSSAALGSAAPRTISRPCGTRLCDRRHNKVTSNIVLKEKARKTTEWATTTMGRVLPHFRMLPTVLPKMLPLLQ